MILVYVLIAAGVYIAADNDKESEDMIHPDFLLLTAIDENDYDKAKEAISKGANVNELDKRYKDDIGEAAFGNIPLQIAFSNKYDVGKIIQLLIENGADVNAVYKSSGESNLMHCAREGDIPFVAILLAYNANVDYCMKNGETALSYAAINEIDDEATTEDMIELLLDYDAKVTAKSIDNAFHGYSEYISPQYRLTKLVLENAEKEVLDDSSLKSDLIKAFTSQEDAIDIIKKISNKPELSETDIQIVLACAAADNTDAIKYFLENSGDVNLTEEYGLTLLMVAASCGSEQVLKLLLENGAEIDPVDNKGESALFKAKKFREEACYRELLQHIKESEE